MLGISKESIFLISALLKCLIYAILENCFDDKPLRKPYLPNVFVFFMNVGRSVIIAKGISFLLDAG